MHKLLIHISEKLYEFVLQFYPKRYRREFEGEMKYVFSETLKDAYAHHGEPGLFSVWVRTTFDTIESLFIQHIEEQRGGVDMNTKITKSIVRVAAVTGAILLIPIIGMQVSSEWNWNLFDFIVMGALVFGTGSLIELARHKVKSEHRRSVIIAIIVLACLYVWAELAVGIFTNLGS